MLTINVPFGSSATLPCSCHPFSRHSFLKHFLEVFTKYHKSLSNTSMSKYSHFCSSCRTDSIFGSVPLLHNEHVEKTLIGQSFTLCAVQIGELVQCCSEVKGDSNANRKRAYFPTCHWHLHFPSFRAVFTSHVLISCLFACTIKQGNSAGNNRTLTNIFGFKFRFCKRFTVSFPE